MIKVAPSLLAADYLRVGEEIRRMAEAGADILHFDVMDGSFVPNISFGCDMARMAAGCGLPVDAHLMVVNPEKHIDAFAYLCDVRGADEGHRHVAYSFELLVDKETAELPAVGVPQHGNVHGGDSFPGIVLHLFRQKDHAGAGAEGGQTVGDLLTDRKEQLFVLHDPEHRGALSAGEDHTIFRLLPVAQFPYKECLHM